MLYGIVTSPLLAIPILAFTGPRSATLVKRYNVIARRMMKGFEANIKTSEAMIKDSEVKIKKLELVKVRYDRTRAASELGRDLQDQGGGGSSRDMVGSHIDPLVLISTNTVVENAHNA